ncbi:hypothetical protein KKF29_02740, partial [Patescibacteria group bacterium]|nr:hypothetical protein [Patescibacteria group bacterium]
MEEIDFLKSGNKNQKAKTSKKDVDYHNPKEEKPKKEKKKKEKKGIFSSLFKPKKEKPEPKKKEAPTPVGLTPEEKEKISEILKEVEAKPKTKSKKVIIPPEKLEKKEEKKEEVEETIEKIKNGEIPLNAVDVNLIPKELLAELKPEKKIINLVWIGFATSLLVVIVYATLFYLQSTYLTKTEINHQKMEELEDDIISYRPLQKQVEGYNESITRINQLLEQHIYWSVFFEMLQEYTLPNVSFASLSGGTDGTFTITANAPDYATITNQIEVLKQAENFVKNIEVTSATATVEEEVIKSVNFNITLQVNPDIFVI